MTDLAETLETYGQFDVSSLRGAQMNGDGKVSLFMETVDHGRLCMIIPIGELVGAVSAIVRHAPQAANWPMKRPLVINGGRT
jgi:hypothetical protein